MATADALLTDPRVSVAFSLARWWVTTLEYLPGVDHPSGAPDYTARAALAVRALQRGIEAAS